MANLPNTYNNWEELQNQIEQGGGGGGDVTKEYVDNKVAEERTRASGVESNLSNRINTLNTDKQDKLTDDGTQTAEDGNKLSFVDLINKKVKYIFLSDIYTYIKNKINGAVSNILNTNLNANRVCVTDTNGKVSNSANISTEELNALENIESNIQNQLNDKQDKVTQGAEITSITDNTVVSFFDLVNKKIQDIKFSNIWSWITNKLKTTITSALTDTDIVSGKAIYDEIQKITEEKEATGNNAVSTTGLDTNLTRTSGSHQSTTSRVLKKNGIVYLQYFSQYSCGSTGINNKFTCIGTVGNDFLPKAKTPITIVGWSTTPAAASGYVDTNGRIYVWVSTIAAGTTNIQFIINVNWKSA